MLLDLISLLLGCIPIYMVKQPSSFRLIIGAGFVLAGGGGIKGGQVIGASDENGAYVASRATSMGDIFATIYKAFGIDWTIEYPTAIGRPVKIANSLDDETGQPIAELL